MVLHESSMKLIFCTEKILLVQLKKVSNLVALKFLVELEKVS